MDYSIKKTVIGKKAKKSSRREVILNVVDIDKKEKRAEDSTLRYTRKDLTGVRGSTVYKDILCTALQKRRHPIMKRALNAYTIQFRK